MRPTRPDRPAQRHDGKGPRPGRDLPIFRGVRGQAISGAGSCAASSGLASESAGWPEKMLTFKLAGNKVVGDIADRRVGTPAST